MRTLRAERKLEAMKLDYLVAYVKKVDRIGELLGWKRGGKSNAGSGVGEAIKDILEVFKCRPSAIMGHI